MDDQPQAPQYAYQQSKADQARCSVPWFLLPLMIFIRPGRFMLSWGIHANIFWVLITAWLIGASGMINTVVNRVRLAPESLPITIDSWATVWAVILGFGILRGIIFGYGFGGLWTWLRLRICGIKGNEWKRSTRIFCLSQIFEQSASLLALLYFSMKYDTLRDFIAQPVSLVNLAAGLFVLLSPIIAFVGVLACYKLRVVWATILFLVIPMLWRLVMLGALGYALLTSTGSVLLPDTQHPVGFTSDVLNFEHPDDWQVAPQTASDRNQIEATIESTSDEGSFLIRVQPREEVDLIAFDLNQIAEMGYTITRTTPEPKSGMGNHRGIGADYDLEKGGKRYRMYHLIVHFDVDHDVLFRAMASKRYWNASKRAVFQIVNSVSIGDLYQINPDLTTPMKIGREVYSFEAPGNWHLNESQREPFTNLEISAKQYSWFTTMIIDRDLTAQAELDMYLNHSIDDQLVSHTKLTTWMGLKGVGAQGQLRESLAGYQQFKALYVQLADGRLLVVKSYQAESSKDLTGPAFNLIESTFKLRVDPAP